MLSPFPGMDPFLEEEDPAEWSSVHVSLITVIRDQLADAVSPHFFVAIEQRVYIVEPDGEKRGQPLIPDLYLVLTPPSGMYGAIEAEITSPVLIEPVYPIELRDYYLEIRDSKSREVVTTIELLSPINKTKGAEAYDAFQAKRQRVMYLPVHWIEIDLLRAGQRPVEMANKSDYYALLKRGRPGAKYEVWFFNLHDRMPTIAVPLRPPYKDVPLDLQAAFDTMYQRAHYGDVIDYTGAVPDPLLKPADAAWVEEQVQKWQAARER